MNQQNDSVAVAYCTDVVKTLLAYHIVHGKVMVPDVKAVKAKVVNGQLLDVAIANSVVTMDDAKVVKTIVAASNGVIYIIDTAVLPS